MNCKAKNKLKILIKTQLSFLSMQYKGCAETVALICYGYVRQRIENFRRVMSQGYLRAFIGLQKWLAFWVTE